MKRRRTPGTDKRSTTDLSMHDQLIVSHCLDGHWRTQPHDVLRVEKAVMRAETQQV